MRFIELAIRNLKEIYRDRVALGFLMGMPVIFILIFGFAFGNQSSSVMAVDLGVVQQDTSPQASAFVQMLNSAAGTKSEDAPVLYAITYETESEAMARLKAGHINGFVVIPDGFGKAVAQNTFVPLNVYYDANDPTAASRVVATVRGLAMSFLQVQIPLELKVSGTSREITSGNEFMNFFVPGMTIYGLMILVPTMVGMIGRDKEKGFLSRLYTFPFRPFDFILGYSLPFIPIMAAQVLLYTGVGMLMGLKIIGNFGLAFLIFFLVGLCCIGIAMIVGSQVKTQQQGEPVSWIFLIPLAMLSGVWFSVDMMPAILTNTMKLFPFVHAVDASRQVVTSGVGFADILADLYWIIGWAVVFFAVGIVAFQRKMKS